MWQLLTGLRWPGLAQAAARAWTILGTRGLLVSCTQGAHARHVPSASFPSYARRCPTAPTGRSTSDGTQGVCSHRMHLVYEILFDSE
jgi:hypothetical protein